MHFMLRKVMRKKLLIIAFASLFFLIILIFHIPSPRSLYARFFNTPMKLNITPFEELFEMEPVDLKIGKTEFSFNMSIPDDKYQFEGVELIVYTMTLGDEDSFEKREAIREVIAKTTNRSILFRFFIGRSDTLNLTILIPEVKKYNDIVYYDHNDTYRENYAKWYAIHEYHLKFCSHIKHLVKMDHDVVVDFGRFFQWLDYDFAGLITNQSQYFLCHEMRGFSPYRTKGDKWYISYDEYPRKWWPNYCYGYFVLTTTETVKTIQKTMKKMNLVHMDDAFITGIVRKNASLPVYNWVGIYNQPQEVRYEPCGFQEGIHTFFAVHNIKHRIFMSEWLEDMRTLEC